MNNTVISIKNLTKEYRLGIINHGTLHQDIQSWWAMIRGKEDPNSLLSRRQHSTASSNNSHLLALNNVSFDIRRGEILGIIGRNGAGKSTLLKILSRVTAPTRGTVKIKGRIASLLEVGTGFHPELTGRENVYLNGAIMGMTRGEINNKFDEIIAFADVEKFIDTPVKRYSSGMYVRLAFAVAAHLEPEILIVDEVLAVGDASFQKKCLGKMGDVAKNGRTILFVSHNMGAIKRLCNSSLLLSEGNLLVKGTTNEVVDEYLVSVSGDGAGKGKIHWPSRKTAPGGEEMRLASIRLLNEKNEVQDNFDGEKPIAVEINYELFEMVRGMEISLQVINSESVVIFTSTDYGQRPEELKAGMYSSICTIPGGLLNSGLYFIRINANIPCVKVLVRGWEFVSFHAERTFYHSSISLAKWQGMVAPRLNWKTERTQE